MAPAAVAGVEMHLLLISPFLPQIGTTGVEIGLAVRETLLHNQCETLTGTLTNANITAPSRGVYASL
jgi:hypothetical protein